MIIHFKMCIMVECGGAGWKGYNLEEKFVPSD